MFVQSSNSNFRAMKAVFIQLDFSWICLQLNLGEKRVFAHNPFRSHTEAETEKQFFTMAFKFVAVVLFVCIFGANARRIELGNCGTYISRGILLFAKAFHIQGVSKLGNPASGRRKNNSVMLSWKLGNIL